MLFTIKLILNDFINLHPHYLEDYKKGFYVLINDIIIIFYVGQENSPSWTNQGPQQWDQSGSVDGHFPHSMMPQDPYNQMDQQGQLQHGTVPYATLTQVSC